MEHLGQRFRFQHTEKCLLSNHIFVTAFDPLGIQNVSKFPLVQTDDGDIVWRARVPFARIYKKVMYKINRVQLPGNWKTTIQYRINIRELCIGGTDEYVDFLAFSNDSHTL